MKDFGKQEQFKLKINRRKEIMKVREEINEIEILKKIKRSKKIK
jgi:hypothetical protein